LAADGDRDITTRGVADVCCFAEIAMFVFGVIALVKGSFSLSRSRVVKDVPARVIGAVLLLPLPVGQGIGFLWGLAIGMEKGAKGQQVTAEDIRPIEKTLTIINVAVASVCLVAAVAIAVATAQPAKKKRRRAERVYQAEELEDLDADRPRYPDDRFRE
jgi:hypothetical protein